jgi:hypothetical protein
MVRRKRQLFLCDKKSCRRQTDRHKGSNHSYCRRHQTQQLVTQADTDPVSLIETSKESSGNPNSVDSDDPKTLPKLTHAFVFSTKVKGWNKKSLDILRKGIVASFGHKADGHIRWEVPLTVKYDEVVSRIMMTVAPTIEKKIGIAPDCFLPPTKGGILVAPAAISSSRPWRRGQLHRDVTMTGGFTTYTFIFLVDDITADNGAIELFDDTCYVPAYEKEGSAVIFARMEKAGCNQKRLLTGPAGTLLVFDSRCLHRSLPNTTDKARWTINWLMQKFDPINKI